MPFFRGGSPITVEADDLKTPVWFIWRGHTHVVERVENRWRVDWGWWWLRVFGEYFLLTTDTGLLALVYRDLQSQGWFLERVYD